RPKKAFLEVSVFLGRPLKAPQIRRVNPASKTKFVHVVHIRHRDEVESPISDWLREAYEFADVRAARAPARAADSRRPARKPTAKLGHRAHAAPRQKAA